MWNSWINGKRMANKEVKSQYYYMWTVIYWELRKRVNFGRFDKWYMIKLWGVWESETHKIQQTNESPISVHKGLSSIIYQEKRPCQLVHFSPPTDQRVKMKESKMIV